jgi:hypothetical protein
MDAARHPGSPSWYGNCPPGTPTSGTGGTASTSKAKDKGTKRFHHPIVGDLTLDWDTLICDTAPNQFVIVLTAHPGTPAHDALRILASWADDQASGTDPSGEPVATPQRSR